jgi:hypothetical protein
LLAKTAEPGATTAALAVSMNLRRETRLVIFLRVLREPWGRVTEDAAPHGGCELPNEFQRELQLAVSIGVAADRAADGVEGSVGRHGSRRQFCLVHERVDKRVRH